MRAVTQCDYCLSSRFTPLVSGIKDRLGISKGTHTFISCDSCGAALLSPRPGNEELAAYYPDHYTFSTDSTGASRMRHMLSVLEYWLHCKWIYAFEAKIAACLIEKNSGRLLDVGCGSGFLMREFRKLGFAVQGMEPRREAADYITRTMGIEVKPLFLDALTAHYAPESLDVIVASHVLEHVTDPATHMRNFHALLKSGGAVVLNFPMIDGFQFRLFGRRWMNITEAPRHVSLPSQAAIRQLCADAGFSDVRTVADSALIHAACIAISLVPRGATSMQYGRGGKYAALHRVLLACVTWAALPFCYVGKYWLRPSASVSVAFKK